MRIGRYFTPKIQRFLSKRMDQPACVAAESTEEEQRGTKRKLKIKNKGEQTIEEGAAKIKLPSNVFYNNAQIFNRDLSVCVLKQLVLDRAFVNRKLEAKNSKNREATSEAAQPLSSSGIAQKICIVEPLAASGLRSIRYALEIPRFASVTPTGVQQAGENETPKSTISEEKAIEDANVQLYVISNDLSPEAAAMCRQNALANGVSHRVLTACDDASLLLLKLAKAMREKRNWEQSDAVTKQAGTACKVSEGDSEERFFDPERDQMPIGGLELNVIDLDPYGSARPFLDSALAAIADGGVLCVTCTDMTVLCGVYPETAFTRYASVAVGSRAFVHEAALRTLLYNLQQCATRVGKTIEPLASLSIDFYVRIFVRVRRGALAAKQSVAQSAYVAHCPRCPFFSLMPIGRFDDSTPNTTSKELEPEVESTSATRTKSGGVFRWSLLPASGECSECGARLALGGPIWSAPIHDSAFCRRLVASLESGVLGSFERSRERIAGMLSVASEELHDTPLFITLAELCAAFHSLQPSFIQFRSALLNAGYRVSISHCHPQSVKTNAPLTAVYDIIRCWIRDGHPIRPEQLAKDPVMRALLERTPKLNANFQTHPEANPQSRKQRLARFPQNPEPNWGPKPRAKRIKEDETGAEALAE